jgi:hypothetical protein
MTQPQVEGDVGIAEPESETGTKRTGDNSSQPAKLSRPLEESARLANMEDLAANELLGSSWNVSQEDGWRKSGPPTFTEIDPVSGDDGGATDVVITGAYFTGATAVTLGGVALTDVEVVDDTTITGTTGAHAAGDVDLVVTTPHGVVTADDAFEYTA